MIEEERMKNKKIEVAKCFHLMSYGMKFSKVVQLSFYLLYIVGSERRDFLTTLCILVLYI